MKSGEFRIQGMEGHIQIQPRGTAGGLAYIVWNSGLGARVREGTLQRFLGRQPAALARARADPEHAVRHQPGVGLGMDRDRIRSWCAR